MQAIAYSDPDEEKQFHSINLGAFLRVMNELINEPFYLLL